MISQLALSQFIKEGHYLHHVAKRRNNYFKRRSKLTKTLNTLFQNRVKILGSATRLHLIAQFDNFTFFEKDIYAFEDAGARFHLVSTHSLWPEKHRDKLLIGYGDVSRQQITSGIEILHSYLSARPQTPT